MRSSVWRAKRPVEPVTQEPMERADAERPDRSRWTRSAPSARSSSDGCAPSTSRRASREHAGSSSSLRSANASALAEDGSSHWTSSIGDQQRPPFAPAPAARSDRDRERARIDGVVGRLVAEQRDLERAPPRRRQPGRTSSRTSSKQIAEPDVREALARPRPDATRARASPRVARMLDAGEPERRLADARLALEHEGGRPAPRSPTKA